MQQNTNSVIHFTDFNIITTVFCQKSNVERQSSCFGVPRFQAGTGKDFICHVVQQEPLNAPFCLRFIDQNHYITLAAGYCKT